MRIARANLDSAFNKISDFTSNDKQVPGILLNIIKEDGASEITVGEQNAETGETEIKVIGVEGNLKMCYSDTSKHFMNDIKVIVEPTDVLGGVVVDYNQLQRAISNCKTSSGISVNEVVFQFTSNKEGKNIIKISADMLYTRNTDDGEQIKIKKGVKQMDISWVEPGSSNKTAVLARPNYESVFEDGQTAVVDDISKDSLIDALTRTSASDGAIIYFSDKSDSVFTNNKTHTTIYKLSKKELSDDETEGIKRQAEQMVMGGLYERFNSNILAISESLKQEVHERLLPASEGMTEEQFKVLLSEAYTKELNDKCKNWLKQGIEESIVASSATVIESDELARQVKAQFDAQFSNVVQTKYNELVAGSGIERNLHSQLVISRAMAKSLIGILGKTSSDTVSIYTSKKENEKADVIYCTLYVDNEDERFGLRFGMNKINSSHMNTLTKYVGAKYDTYQLTFLREFMLDTFKSARDATKNDKTVLQFIKSKDTFIDGRPKYTLAISSESASASISDIYSVECEDVVDPNGTIALPETKITVSLAVIVSMLEQLKTDMIAFDFADMGNSLYYARIAEIDAERMVAERDNAIKNYPDRIGEHNGMKFVPIDLKMGYRSKALGVVQYAMLKA